MILRTLGHLTLEGSSFTKQKPLLLLTYLAIEGPKPRRYLAELFFMETCDPFNSLSRALSYLRKYAPETLETNNTLVKAMVSCDYTALLNAFTTCAFQECLSLYQGAFLADLNIKLSPELEEWLYSTRELLAAKVRRAYIVLSDQAVRQGELYQAVWFAERAYQLSEAPEFEPEDMECLYRLLQAGGSSYARRIRDEAPEFYLSSKAHHRDVKVTLPELANTNLV